MTVSAHLACEEFDDDDAELAVGGIAEPHRSALLLHAAGCPSCDARLRALADIADRLLLLAPTTEPPPGFESRVLERIGLAGAPRSNSRHRGRRLLSLGVAVAIIGGVLLATWIHDRASVTPAAVAAGAIVSPTGARVGLVRLVDQPRPHILLVIDHPGPASGERSCELDLDGRWVVVGTASWLCIRSTIGSPRRAAIVGPGNWPSYPHTLVFSPGRISLSAARWVIS